MACSGAATRKVPAELGRSESLKLPSPGRRGHLASAVAARDTEDPREVLFDALKPAARTKLSMEWPARRGDWIEGNASPAQQRGAEEWLSALPSASIAQA
jgi:hypothetical protein